MADSGRRKKEKLVEEKARQGKAGGSMTDRSSVPYKIKRIGVVCRPAIG